MIYFIIEFISNKSQDESQNDYMFCWLVGLMNTEIGIVNGVNHNLWAFRSVVKRLVADIVNLTVYPRVPLISRSSCS